MNNKHYNRLLIMVALSVVSMYILMYAMANTFADVYSNLNQFYMAGLMTAPMVLIELFLMRAMYTNKKFNTLIIAAGVIAFTLFFTLIRQQTAITDKQFLRSMIVHHSSALLMCEKASIQNSEIKELCEVILSSQQSQIDQMKIKLNELSR